MLTEMQTDPKHIDALSMDMEELEALDAPTWGEFFGGVAIGVGAAGVVAGGIGVGVAIT